MNTVINPPQAEQITLYCREGSSDKVYQASIEPQGELFVVNFAHGRRGATLQTGTRISSPVDYDTAKGIYDNLIREKMGRGYTPGYATLCAVVAKLNPQRSVELRLLSCQGWIPIGNVTIPVSRPVPEVGSVVKVGYRYAFRESQVLYQPTYLGARKDIEPHECILSQLKFKATEDEEDGQERVR